MIYTVTFNPSLDYVMYLPNLESGVVNRAASEMLYPGGKGINVSIMLTRLGLENIALGFVSGFTGRALKNMLDGVINADFIELPVGETRINVKLKAQIETDINGHGPDIPNDCLEMLFAKLNELRNGDILILAGSIPSSLSQNIYEEIFLRLVGREILFVVDATKGLLKKVLPYRPFLIKPNLHELGELFGVTITEHKDLIRYAREVCKLGARNVLVSMGKDGALLITEYDSVIEGCAPDGVMVNSVGAGDSMVAGFLAGWLKSNSFETALSFGLAAGSATAFGEWLAERDEVNSILNMKYSLSL